MPDFPNVVRLKGDIDMHVSADVADSLRQVIATRPSRFVIDMSAVTYFDSSGLSVLICANNDIEEYGGTLVLSGVRENVKSLIELCGLGRFFVTCPHVVAALTAT